MAEETRDFAGLLNVKCGRRDKRKEMKRLKRLSRVAFSKHKQSGEEPVKLDTILSEEAARTRKIEKKRLKRMRRRQRRYADYRRSRDEQDGGEDAECTRFGTDLSARVEEYLGEAASQRRERMGEMLDEEGREIKRLEKRLTGKRTRAREDQDEDGANEI